MALYRSSLKKEEIIVMLEEEDPETATQFHREGDRSGRVFIVQIPTERR